MTAFSTLGGPHMGAPAMSSSSNSYYKEKRPHGYEKYSVPNMSPEAMELYKQLFPFLGPESDIARLAAGDEGAFAEMEAPALRQFQDIMGGLASKFSGAGMGGRHSSGFSLAGTQAASSFAQDLAAKRQETKSQALRDMMDMANMLMGQKPMEHGFKEKQPKSTPWWQSALKAGGTAAASAFGGPAGGALYGAASSLF